MPNFTQNILVDRPQKEVFLLLSNPENSARYLPAITRCEILDPLPLAKGTRFREWRKFGNKEVSAVITIAEYTPYTRYVVESTAMGVCLRYEYFFSALADHQTQITLSMTTVAKGFAKLIAPLLLIMAKKQDGGQLPLLQKFCNETK